MRSRPAPSAQRIPNLEASSGDLTDVRLVLVLALLFAGCMGLHGQQTKADYELIVSPDFDDGGQTVPLDPGNDTSMPEPLRQAIIMLQATGQEVRRNVEAPDARAIGFYLGEAEQRASASPSGPPIYESSGSRYSINVVTSL